MVQFPLPRLLVFLLASSWAACADSGDPSNSDDDDGGAVVDDDTSPSIDDDSSSPDDDSTPPDDDSTPPDDDSSPLDDDSTPPTDDDTSAADDDTTPDPEEGDLDGAVYLVDLTTATWEPAAVGSILWVYFDFQLLMGVDGHTASTIDMTAAIGSEDEGGTVHQELCYETIPLTDAVEGSFSNPYFEVGPADFHFDVGGAVLDLSDTSIAGRFASSFGTIVDGDLSGIIDLSAFDSWLGGEGATCELTTSLGIECGLCPDGITESCIDVKATEMEASRVPLVLLPRTTEDIAADPGC